MTKRMIGVVTVGRSDYDRYVPIMRKIMAHDGLALKLYVTGAHLLSKFGNTVEAIRQDSFPIAAVVPVDYSGDEPGSIGSAMGAITAGFAKVFAEERPDILLVLGDRFEMHAAALAAIPFNIPLAHLHGGELTYGAFDEYFRHSLTKLSHLHFAATAQYASRIIQMGEEPWRVIVSGATGLDNVLEVKRLTKEELATRFGIDFSYPVVLVAFHPVTLEHEHTGEYIKNLFGALEVLCDVSLVLTYPNADPGSATIIREIEQFARTHQRVVVVKNFGMQGFMSMLASSSAMVGNSSSGIIEAPSFKLPVVNIGTRQDGRVRARNVIDVGYTASEILTGLHTALSQEFRESLRDLMNPYGDGTVSERVVKVLAEVDIAKLKPKRFYDLPQQNIP